MKSWFRLPGMVLWITLLAACGEDALPPVQTVNRAPLPSPVQTPTQGRIETVILGTGEATGAYYLIGEAMATVINIKASAYRLHCAVEITGGSLLNIHAVLSGDQQFGLVQSQRSHEAAKGVGNWKARGAQKELRSVFSLPFDPETPTVDSGTAALASGTGAPPEAESAPFRGRTTLVTSAKVPEWVVYNLTKAAFENLAKLQDLHPAFAGATPPRMLEGLSAPIHPGALKYFKEAGLM